MACRSAPGKQVFTYGTLARITTYWSPCTIAAIWLMPFVRSHPLVCVGILAAVAAVNIAVVQWISSVPMTVEIDGCGICLKQVFNRKTLAYTDIVSIEDGQRLLSNLGLKFEGSLGAPSRQRASAWMVVKYRQNGKLNTLYIHSCMAGFFRLLKNLCAQSSFGCDVKHSDFSIGTGMSLPVLGLAIATVLCICGAVLIATANGPMILMYPWVICVIAAVAYAELRLPIGVRTKDDSLVLQLLGKRFVEIPWSEIDDLEVGMRLGRFKVVSFGGFRIRRSGGRARWIPPYFGNYLDLMTRVAQKLDRLLIVA